MTAAVPLRPDLARRIRSGAFVLALCFPALAPVLGQNASTPGGPGFQPLDPLTNLLGPWIRNEQRSEDPGLKVERMGLVPEAASPTIHELAEALADRYGTVMIRTLGDAVVLLDGRGGTRVLSLDGRRQPLGRGVRGRVIESGHRLEIEMVAADWQRFDTFFRQQDRLVRTTELQSGSQPWVEFRTVYDRPESPSSSNLPVARLAGGARPSAIQIVPPEQRFGELLSGRVEVQTLVIDPLVAEVEFLLDGKRTRRLRKPPFTTSIVLANPPREHRLEALAHDSGGEYIGSDEILLNQLDQPFAVTVVEIRSLHEEENPAIRVAASVSLPQAATLDRVEFYRSEQLVSATNTFVAEAAPGTARTVPVEALIEDARADDFIRVVAKLADGREREDAELLQGADYQSEIDIQLVQLQVLVTDRDGNPAGGLSPEDFAIRERGKKRQAVGVHTARDVHLVLGLAIDSSDSMLPAWARLKQVARGFLQSTLTPEDRAFLVDFDDTVSLVQPMTGDQSLLSGRLDHLIPLGGTALNDGLLFALLRYRREPGRRALIVITDGADQHSRSRPDQSADFARRLGLPIYFIELDAAAESARNAIGGFVATNPTSRRQRLQTRKRLIQISEQTGGRLFHIALDAGTPEWTDRIGQVFGLIEADLRHQHVLTYYSDQPPGSPIEPEIRMTRRDLKLRSAVPLEAIE